MFRIQALLIVILVAVAAGTTEGTKSEALSGFLKLEACGSKSTGETSSSERGGLSDCDELI